MSAWTSLIAAAVMAVSSTGASYAAPPSVKVDATYEISIAGWGLARGTLDMSYNDGKYDADLLMVPKGVARIVTAVRTSVAASGALRGQTVLPSAYRVRATETDKPVSVDMQMSGGAVRNERARPALKKLPGRIEVKGAHKRGIVDPLSSGLIPIRTQDGRDACNRTLNIYDGWTRYDVRLNYRGMRDVKTEGFTGKVAVCGARWVPISGHRPQKKEVQYLEANTDLEMTVVPIPAAGIAIPYGVAIGTPNGKIRIEPSSLRISGTGV